jgi:hypothetical protein
VGGHCIGVDSYYHHAQGWLAIDPQIILAGRRTSDGTGKHVAEQSVTRMIPAGPVKAANVSVLRLTLAHRAFAQRPLAEFLDKVAPKGVVADVGSMLDTSALRAKGVPV